MNVPFAKVLANSRLVQAISLKEETSDVLGILAGDKAGLDEELNALFGDVSRRTGDHGRCH